MGNRKSAADIAAREKARKLQAQYDVLANRRLGIATKAVALREDLADFDAETEKLVAQLVAKRGAKRDAMHAQLGALADEMIDTKVNRAEAAGRLGMSLAEMNAARKAFDDAVRARAELPAPAPAPSAAGESQAAPVGAEPSSAHAPAAPVPGSAPAPVTGSAGGDATAAAVPRQDPRAGLGEGAAMAPAAPPAG